MQILRVIGSSDHALNEAEILQRLDDAGYKLSLIALRKHLDELEPYLNVDKSECEHDN